MNSDESHILTEYNPTIYGSATIEGNLDVQGQTTTNGISVISNGNLTLSANSAGISFQKIATFIKGAQFNNGKTIIGTETTYNSAYVGSQTIQAGDRLVLGEQELGGYTFEIPGTLYNEADIEVDPSNNSIVSITVTNFGDTAGVGDAAVSDSALAQYAGKTLDDSVDSVSGATFTSDSIASMASAALKMAAGN